MVRVRGYRPHIFKGCNQQLTRANAGRTAALATTAAGQNTNFSELRTHFYSARIDAAKEEGEAACEPSEKPPEKEDGEAAREPSEKPLDKSSNKPRRRDLPGLGII